MALEWQQRNRREVRAFYGFDDDQDEDAEETGGVREPRRPRGPVNSAGAALEVPRAEDALSPTSVDHVSVV